MIHNKLLHFEESKQKKIVFLFFSASIWLYLYLSSQISCMQYIGHMATFLLMTQSLFLILRSFIARNILFVIFFGFIFLYTLPPKLFFFDEIFLSAHNQYYTYSTVTHTTLIFALFLIIVNVYIKIPPLWKMKRIEFKNNSLVFTLIYVAAFIIVLTSKRTGSLYDGSADVVELSVLNEYVIILFLILYIYSANKFYNLLLLSILYTLYAVFALLNGGRIEVVLLLLLLLNVRFQYTISFNKIFLFFILGVWVMSMLGTLRQNPQLLLSGNITNVINPFAGKDYRMNSQNSNEGDVYWASERMLLLINKGELSVSDRIEAGISYFLSAFVPVSWLSPLANLPDYKRNIEPSGGGGLAPIYFYVMFGWLGVLLGGYFVAQMLNSLSKNISEIKLFYIILMITMLARWFAYNPIQLVKLCVWGTILYYFIKNLDYTIKKYR